MIKRNWKKHLNVLLSATLMAGLVLPALPSKAVAATNATDLIISEYVEGTSNNKAIELYNGTGSDLDLSNYSIELYANGKTSGPAALKLSGTLANGKTYVIYNNQANAALKNKGDLQNSTVTAFNGDDVLLLKKSTEVVDSFGQLGSTTKWGENVTLVKKASVLSGDSNPNDVYDVTVQWDSYPIDTFDHLGSHTMGGTTPVEPDPEEPEEPTSITVAEARSGKIGDTVTIKAIVAANLKNSISVQDGTAGIAVRPASLPATIGDEVIVSGKLAEYLGLLQLDNATIVDKQEQVGAPAPKVVTGAEVNEANESLLVQARDITLTAVNANNFTATDGTNSFIVRDEKGILNLKVGNVYESITGIVQQFNNDYQIIPRFASDIVEDSSILQSVVATPGSGTYVGGPRLLFLLRHPVLKFITR